MNKNEWINKLQQQFNDNPLGTIAVGSLAVTAVSKLLNSLSDVKRSRVWSREIARREAATFRRRR